MRYVAEEPSLAIHEITNTSSHAVEVAYEVRNFVFAATQFSAGPRIQISFCQGMGGSPEASNGPREVKCEQEAGDARQSGADEDKPQQPGPAQEEIRNVVLGN